MGALETDGKIPGKREEDLIKVVTFDGDYHAECCLLDSDSIVW
jgi:hypothetical protein